MDEKYTISDKLWAGFVERKKRNKKNGKGFGYGIVDKDSEYTNTISGELGPEVPQIRPAVAEHHAPVRPHPRDDA